MGEQTEIKDVSGKEAPSIYELIKRDHKELKKLFKQVDDSEKYNAGLYLQVKKALLTHMLGEEKFFYSQLENRQETRQVTLEAYEEHDVGKQIINDIDMSDNTKEDWLFAKIKVLSQATELHIRDEEDELFKKAKKVLSHKEEHEIGRLFEQEKINAATK